jgi:GntR family transcriptional regulator, transcriptional repressor for pyruvate dehydrogenase complex
MAERLSQTVANDLLAQITRGEYGAGDRLPSEQQLMDRYRVGRNTVREAMQSLRTLGLVDIRPRLGARVLGQAAPNTLANSAVSMLIGDQTVTELYEVRLILEPAAAAIAAKHRSDDDLLAMRRARTHYRVAYEMGTPVWEADIEFHQAIAEASGNAVLAKVLAPVSDLLNNARQATGTLPAAVEIALGQHDEIAEAIEARAATRARRAMTRHIESGIWAVNQLTDAERTTGALTETESPARAPGRIPRQGRPSRARLGQPG